MFQAYHLLYPNFLHKRSGALQPPQMHFVVGDCWKWTRRFQEQILWVELFTHSCLWPQVRLVWTHLSTLEMQCVNFTSIWMSLFYPCSQNLPSNACNPSLWSFHLQSFGFNCVHKRLAFFNCVISCQVMFYHVPLWTSWIWFIWICRRTQGMHSPRKTKGYRTCMNRYCCLMIARR